MRKILNILYVGLLVLVLSSCDSMTSYLDSIRPEAYAPALTENEAAFVDMIPTLKKASVSINNHFVLDGKNETRKGSGVIVKKEVTSTTTNYYVLTSQWVVEHSVTVDVFYTSTNSTSALVLNPKLVYEWDEDIAIIRFSTNYALNAVELKAIDEERNLENLTIFSIGTPVSNGYYNYVTNPALIMGVYENRIVHGTNLNLGTLGSPLYLKSTGELVGINVKYSLTSGGRPEVLLNEAIFINRVIELVEGFL